MTGKVTPAYADQTLSMPARGHSAHGQPGRIGWVDYAKGFCIVMVVMMHSTLGVEAAAGAQSWMHGLVAFAKPFRMPDFFLIAGLFLAVVIGRDWRTYLDRKVLHFAYFYALWVTIQFALRAPGITAEQGFGGLALAYLAAYVEPFGTLWFIYLLPVFFVVTRLLRALPWWLVFAAAAALEIAPVHTGSTVIDEFASRYVYFFAGYALAGPIFGLAARIQAHAAVALAGLGAWALVNGYLVFAGFADLPAVSLLLGFAGAAAVVALSALLAKLRLASVLRYCGEHSLIVYLAFSPFMAAARIASLKFAPGADPGMIAVLVTLIAVSGPLLLHLVVRSTPARYLFVRPQWAKLAPSSPRRAFQPAE